MNSGQISGLLLALLLPAGAMAEDFWLALGSYRDVAQAERALTTIRNRLPESLVIAPAETDGQTRYRVLAGPYLRRDLAVSVLNDARARGYQDAWILRTDIDGFGAIAEHGNEPIADLPLPPMASAGQSEPAGDVLTEAERMENRLPVLVEQAPAGYGLHRLRRSGTLPITVEQ